MSLAKTSIAGLALAVSALALTPSLAQAGIVVSSSGPSAGQFPVGREIDDNQRITLRDGDTITVLDDGGTRVLRGAGTFMLARQSGANRNQAFAALTTQRSASRARTGAVRGAGPTEVSNPSLWYIDVSRSGTICLPDEDRIRLWRGDTEDEGIYSISESGEPRKTRQVTFPENEMLAAWSSELPVQEGRTYSVGKTPDHQAAQIEFRFLDAVPEDPEDLAGLLIENGCMVQVEQMSSAMSEGA